MPAEAFDALVAHEREARQLEEGEASDVVDDLGHEPIAATDGWMGERPSTGVL